MSNLQMILMFQPYFSFSFLFLVNDITSYNHTNSLYCWLFDNGKFRVMNDKASAIPISLLNEPLCVCVWIIILLISNLFAMKCINFYFKESNTLFLNCEDDESIRKKLKSPSLSISIQWKKEEKIIRENNGEINVASWQLGNKFLCKLFSSSFLLTPLFISILGIIVKDLEPLEPFSAI